MRKLFFLLTALLTLSAGLWAQETQTVSYLYPVYNTPDDPKSGIKEWKEGSVEATVIASTVNLKAGWYVVLGNDVKTRSMSCSGDVHLILADGAKLTTNVVGAGTGPGLQVVKGYGSLTVYGQAAQSGQLIAKGTGGDNAGIGGSGGSENGKITINGGIIEATGNSSTDHGAAGIGGGYWAEGYGITINGGTVTAIGKGEGNYSGAGIGGGDGRSGHDITINGGIVIASGCWVDGHKSDGIGCGYGNNLTPTNIKVVSTHEVKADNNNPPSTMIGNDGSEDLAGKLKGQCYVTITPSLETEKVYAIAAINAKLEEIDNGNIKGIATIAIASINAATSVAEVNAIKGQALSNIASAQGAYYDGKAAGYEDGKAEALGEMGEHCEDCPAVDVTKGTTTIRLYSPEKVEFRKME